MTEEDVGDLLNKFLAFSITDGGSSSSSKTLNHSRYLPTGKLFIGGKQAISAGVQDNRYVTCILVREQTTKSSH